MRSKPTGRSLGTLALAGALAFPTAPSLAQPAAKGEVHFSFGITFSPDSAEEAAMTIAVFIGAYIAVNAIKSASARAEAAPPPPPLAAAGEGGGRTAALGLANRRGGAGLDWRWEVGERTYVQVTTLSHEAAVGAGWRF